MVTPSRGEREMERSVLEEVCSNRKTSGSRERWQAGRRARVTVSGLRSVQAENGGDPVSWGENHLAWGRQSTEMQREGSSARLVRP